MAPMSRNVVFCLILVLIQTLIVNTAAFEFDTTRFAGSLHPFDVVDALEYQDGFAVLVGSKKPFMIQGKDINRGFAVLLMDGNMKLTRWVDAQLPTMEPVGITLGDDDSLLVVANMNGTFSKQSVCGCTYGDMVMMKDFNPFVFKYNSALQCVGVSEINRKERHGETRPNGPGGQISYCEAYSSVVLRNENRRYHVGVARAGSWCYKSGVNEWPYIWVRIGEDIEAGPHFKVLFGSPNLPTPQDKAVFSSLRIDAADIRKSGTDSILYAAGVATGENMNLRDQSGATMVVNGASFVFAANVEKSKLIWRHLYPAADKVHFSDVHLHHEYLITVASGKSSQVIIDVFRAEDVEIGAVALPGSWISKPTSSGAAVTVHKVGKCVLSGGFLYVPVYLDGKGRWDVYGSYLVDARDEHDVVVLKFTVANDGKIALDGEYKARPQAPASPDDWLEELAIAGTSSRLLGFSTQSVGGFALELRAGLVDDNEVKRVSVVFDAPATCPVLPPREPPMAMYIPSTYNTGDGTQTAPKADVKAPKAAATYTDTREEPDTSASGTSWAIMTIVLVVLGIVLFVVYRRLQARRASAASNSPVYDKVAL